MSCKASRDLVDDRRVIAGLLCENAGKHARGERDERLLRSRQLLVRGGAVHAAQQVDDVMAVILVGDLKCLEEFPFESLEQRPAGAQRHFAVVLQSTVIHFEQPLHEPQALLSMHGMLKLVQHRFLGLDEMPLARLERNERRQRSVGRNGQNAGVSVLEFRQFGSQESNGRVLPIVTPPQFGQAVSDVQAVVSSPRLQFEQRLQFAKLFVGQGLCGNHPQACQEVRHQPLFAVGPVTLEGAL